MSLKNKTIICLSVFLVFFTVLSGCGISPSSETVAQSSLDGLTESVSGTSGETEPEETTQAVTEASAEDTTGPATHAGTTAPAKPTTTKPTTVKPTTTVAATTPAGLSGIVLDNLLGQSASSITQQFGNPAATEKSEYGFTWYIYHRNYANFFMIGIQNNKVVGLYSNSTGLSFVTIKFGAAKSSVRAAMSGFTGPLSSYIKGNTEYKFQASIIAQRDVFTDNQKYVTIFYDNINGGTLTAVQIIDYATEQHIGLYPAPDNSFIESYERISFYLINSIRVRLNISRLQYDINMAAIAASHSQDMIDHNYFDHIDSEKKRVGDRITSAGFQWSYCGENIAKDSSSAVYAHENYMNSETHRNVILNGNYRFVGVGVRMTRDTILQTEVFIAYQ
jgi:uncharacterized protein YkwD